MNACNYFKHIRSLGDFPASAALELAREAAALDMAAKNRHAAAVGAEFVAREVMPDDSAPIGLSFGIKVF